MPRTDSLGVPVLLMRATATILIIAALYFAREFLIPLTLAVVLTFVLGPLVRVLERRGLPTLPSVMITATLAIAVFAVLAYFVTIQILGLVNDMPKFRENIKNRMRVIQSQGPNALENAVSGLKSIDREIREETTKAEVQEEERVQEEREKAERETTGQPDAERLLRGNDRTSGVEPSGSEEGERRQSSEKAVRVELTEAPKNTWDQLRSYADVALTPLVNAGIVIIFVIFFLVQRRDLRDRILRLMGHGKLYISTQAMDEAAARLSRYLLMTLLINFTYGLPVAIGLWLIGVPGFVMWGFTAMLLRFIPYVGPWVAAAMPIALSLAVFDGWHEPLMTAGLFVVLELFSNNVMEPWLYGSSTGMSSVAVLVAAVFWGWLWGAIGLVVAVPLTAVLVVAGKYIPPLRYFNILFGSEPALQPHQRFYNRLLALDEEDAVDIAETYLAENGLISLYDDLLMPALHLAERDRHRDLLGPEREQKVGSIVRAVIEEVEEWSAQQEPKRAMQSAVPGGEATPATAPIVCLPARDEADSLAARMLAHLLENRGLGVKLLPAEMLVGQMTEEVLESGTRMVVISAMPPGAMTRSRYLSKRLGPEPEIRVIVGLWCWAGDQKRARSRLMSAGANDVVFTFSQFLDSIRPVFANIDLGPVASHIPEAPARQAL